VPLGPRPFDEPGDAVDVIGVDHRRDRRPVVARVAEHVRVGGGVEAREELVGHRLLDEQSRAAQAHLARVVVLQRGLRRRRIQVGVLEDQERVLAAELGGERHDVLRRGHADVPRGLGRARERHAADERMRHERRAGLLADALHDVEHAGRQAGLAGELGEQRGAERRPLGGLEDDGGARGQRR
jgi:hypothetical protein